MKKKYILAIPLLQSALTAPVLSLETKPSMDRYIVHYSHSSNNIDALKALSLRSSTEDLVVLQPLTKVFNGAIIKANSKAINELSRNPNIKFIEKEQLVIGTTSSWALDRIDQRSLPLNGYYGFDNTGSSVTVYVLDTGIRASHIAFSNRIAPGVQPSSGSFLTDTNDCNGHGTHVAGLIGGQQYGVAKGVTIVPVKVLNIGCTMQGSTVDLIAGIDWVIANHSGPSIINLSLSTGFSPALQIATHNATIQGIPVIAAAGNVDGGSVTNACHGYPAGYSHVFAVASSTNSDQHFHNSRSGTCVDLYAPGSNVVSAGHTSNTASATMSGTSMSAPLVTGVAALLLERDPTLNVETIYQKLKHYATPNAIGNAPANTTQSLLFSRQEHGTADLYVESLMCYGQINATINTNISAPISYQLWFIDYPNFKPQYIIQTSTSSTMFANIPMSGYVAGRACNAEGCTPFGGIQSVHYYNMCL